jgi:hypothetical protein
MSEIDRELLSHNPASPVPASPAKGTPLSSALRRGLESNGAELDAATRSSLEPRFGRDFGQVRVHADAAAGASAAALNATAFTLGRDIVFGAGHYAPRTGEGFKLLTHELTHIVQQSNSSQPASGTSSSQAAEKEANANAMASSGNGVLPVSMMSPSNVAQRQPAVADEEAKQSGPTDMERVVKAADRARRDPSNQTTMMINGSEIVYRLVHAFLPDYDDKLSGVSYRAGVKGVEVDASGGSISITFGNEFILATDARTLEQRALDLGRALFKKAPRPPHKGRGPIGSMADESKKAADKAAEEASKAPAQPKFTLDTTFGYEVPGLGPEKTAKVEELIKAKSAQEAIDLIVANAGVSSGNKIDLALIEDRKFKFDPELTGDDAVTTPPGWDYLKDKARPAKVRVGPPAFSSVPYLYSAIIHEYQHVLWHQKLENQQIGEEEHEGGKKGGGRYTSEVEAYSYALLHAEESGLSKIPEKIAGDWRNLNEEFWRLDAATQRAMRPKVQKARTAAEKFVKGTGVTLDPFQPPQ